MHDAVEIITAAEYQRAWGETYSLPTFIMQMNGRLVWRNASLQAMLDQGSVLRERDSLMAFADRAIQTSFMAFVGALGDRPGAWLGPGREDAGRLILRCERVSPSNHPPGVACMVYDTGHQSRHVWADLGQVFGLTSSEARIARNLADGGTLKGLARDMDITCETAKTHLRRIYAKIDAGSREEFYAKVLPFRVV